MFRVYTGTMQGYVGPKYFEYDFETWYVWVLQQSKDDE